MFSGEIDGRDERGLSRRAMPREASADAGMHFFALCFEMPRASTLPSFALLMPMSDMPRLFETLTMMISAFLFHDESRQLPRFEISFWSPRRQRPREPFYERFIFTRCR